MTTRIDNDIIGAAILGYETQLRSIEQKLAELRAQLRGKPVVKITRTAARKSGGSKKHAMSAAGRKRIAAAQRKRWAAFKKQKAVA
jgi:hypothetical protein